MSSLHNLRVRFRNQFTPTDRGFVYRRGSRGAALPASAEDCDAMIAEFDRSLRRLFWAGIIAAVVLFGLADWAGRSGSPFLARYADYLAVGVFGVGWTLAFRTAWNRPHRLLDGRAPVARALTGGEARADNLRTMPWRVLLLGAGLAVALVVRVAFEPDPWSPTSQGFYAFAAVLLAIVGALAVAKTRAR